MDAKHTEALITIIMRSTGLNTAVLNGLCVLKQRQNSIWQ